MTFEQPLGEVDGTVHDIIQDEVQRQEEGLELIASENFASRAVMEAAGSVMTNKYAEGYPGKRYYGGCENMDRVENKAIERARDLFGCDYVNVQPHSGSGANMATYMALIDPGDTILSMKLDHGGHLSHGAPINFSGRLYDVHHYGVDQEEEVITAEKVENEAAEADPDVIVAGFSAYPREIPFELFRRVADQHDAYLVVDIAHIAGLVATDQHPDPFPQADVVTTTTHKTLRGPRGGMILTNDEELAGEIDSRIFPGTQGGPLMHLIAAKAVAFKEAQQPEFTAYQRQIIENAQALASALDDRGYHIVSGGTDNHLMLVDLRPKDLTGKEAEESLDKVNITTNKNTIPGDPESPFVTSGLRLGSPALTTRGMKEPEMERVAELIDQTLTSDDLAGELETIREEVRELAQEFPLYPFLQEQSGLLAGNPA